MTSTHQEMFEQTVILESDFTPIFTTQGEKRCRTIDDLSNHYLTLAEVHSEYGKDLNLEFRERLVIIINERFDRLSDIQQRIAKMRYNKEMTYREISDKINRSISTISHHMKQINKTLRSI